MISKWILRFILTLWACVASIGYCGHSEPLSLEYAVSVYSETDENLSINEVLYAKHIGLFEPYNGRSVSLGWVEKAHWIQLEFDDIFRQQSSYLEISWPLLDKVDLYIRMART